MSLLLTTVTSISGILLGKFLFKHWLNHLTLYCIIWGGLIFLYELKLLPYPEVVTIAWFLIIGAFLSFLLGIMTVFSAKSLYTQNQLLVKKSNISLPIFLDDGRIVKYAFLFFSLVSIFSGIQHWVIMIHKFGSIPGVFLNASTIYSLQVNREIKGFIPYLPIAGYVGVFFSAIYAAYKGRFSFLTFLPLLGIILKELATVGRAGMLLAFWEFLFTFFLFKHLLNNDLTNRFNFNKKNATFAFIVLVIIFISSASLVRITRGSTEYYSGASRELKQLRNNILVSPSIYLYLSSTVGVLSKYAASEGENLKFGQNTFLPIYDIVAKLGSSKRVNDVQKGYFIPMWTNTGTYVRELHADFGTAGIFIGPYLLGLIITWLWFRFYDKKSIVVLAILVYLYLIVGFSFLEVVSRVSYWFYSFIAIICFIPVVEKAVRITYKSHPVKSVVI